MAEFPALPLWTDAFIGDTMHLTAEETGAYLLLLMAAWRTRDNGLPQDEYRLARFARCTDRRWLRIRIRIMEFWFVADDGLFHQRRLDRERKFVEEKRKQQSERAKAKWLKEKETGDAMAMQPRMPPAYAPTPTPTPTPTPEESKIVGTKESPLSSEPMTPLSNGHAVNEILEAFKAWNVFAEQHGLAPCRKRTTARTAAMRARLKDCGGLDGFQAALAKAGAINGLMGQNDRGWKLGIDSLLRESMFTKLMEGGYDGWTEGGRRAASDDDIAGGILAGLNLDNQA